MPEQQLPETIRVHDTWERASERSKERRAISDQQFTIHLPRGTYVVRLVKPRYGDPYAVYAGAVGIKVHDWKPPTTMIDACRRWQPF